MIGSFFATLKKRNLLLTIFVTGCLLAAVGCVALIPLVPKQVLGISAWIKPLKFFLSAAIYAATLAWYLHYLQNARLTKWFSWMLIAVLGFELVYIFLKAAEGQLSHFNIATPFAGIMYAAMGIAISLLTLCTAYVGYLFFKKPFPSLAPAYLWGIRLGILLFVIFAFEGGIMAAKLTHTVGAADGSPGLPLTNWSTQFGDLRVAHFVGMHALQILPLYGFYRSKSANNSIIAGFIYFIVTALLFLQAWYGQPLF